HGRRRQQDIAGRRHHRQHTVDRRVDHDADQIVLSDRQRIAQNRRLQRGVDGLDDHGYAAAELRRGVRHWRHRWWRGELYRNVLIEVVRREAGRQRRWIDLVVGAQAPYDEDRLADRPRGGSVGGQRRGLQGVERVAPAIEQTAAAPRGQLEIRSAPAAR